jgi:hypothetical protein
MNLQGPGRRSADSWFNMRSNRGVAMDVVVIGMDNTLIKDVEKLRHRVKVVLVPGNLLIIYRTTPNTGFQELDGQAAELYLKSLLR